MNKIESFWNQFLIDTNRDLNEKYQAAFHFELTEKLANELLELVLRGQKKATASSLNSYTIENERLPQTGDLNIVTDWNGNPRGVIQTTCVTILPYKDITYEICKREGEDDNLESWQQGHLRFYKEEGKLLGYEFSEDLLVVFEDFELIYKK